MCTSLIEEYTVMKKNHESKIKKLFKEYNLNNAFYILLNIDLEFHRYLDDSEKLFKKNNYIIPFDLYLN